MFSIIYENVLRLVSLTAGCFYPAFVSYKLLKAQQNNEIIIDKTNIWLTYWIVYGVWSIIDFLTMGLGTCIPFFNEGKLIFICWLLPSIGAGSQLIYDELLESFFSNNELTIERALIDASHAVLNFLDRILRTCLSRIMRVVDDYLLTRGLPQAPETTIPRVDEYFEKLRMEKKTQKDAEDLVNDLERVLGVKAGKDDDDNLSLENVAVPNKTESEDPVFTDCFTKPKVLPKPKRGPRPTVCQETLDSKTILHPNQIVALTQESEKEK